MATRSRGAAATTTTPLERELEQARGGTHPRIVAEEKRLSQIKTGLAAKADQLRKYRLSIVEAQFESERRVAEEVFAREKGIVQNRLIEECIDRQKRHSKVRQPAPVLREKGRTLWATAHLWAAPWQVDKSEQSAVTRKMRQLRGEVCTSPRASTPLRQHATLVHSPRTHARTLPLRTLTARNSTPQQHTTTYTYELQVE